VTTTEERVAWLVCKIESGENTLDDLARALVIAQDRARGLYTTLETSLETAEKASERMGSTVHAQRELVLRLEKTVNLLDHIMQQGPWLAIRDYIAEALYQWCTDNNHEWLANDLRLEVSTMESPAELNSLDRHWIWEASRPK